MSAPAYPPIHQIALEHAKLNRIIRHELTRLLKPYHVSLHEWTLLCLLEEDPAQSPSRLAAKIGVEAPMVTKLLQLLEEKKMITRSVHMHDRRSHKITLTVLGLETTACAQEYFALELESIFGRISAPERSMYLSILHSLCATNETPHHDGAADTVRSVDSSTISA